jgi:predicted  nucleic acid-binding Zn-ribbon protein
MVAMRSSRWLTVQQSSCESVSLVIDSSDANEALSIAVNRRHGALIAAIGSWIALSVAPAGAQQEPTPSPTPLPALAMSRVTAEAQALEPRLDDIEGLIDTGGGFEELEARIAKLRDTVTERLRLTEPDRLPLLRQRQRRALIQEWQTYRDRSLAIEAQLQESIADFGAIRDELQMAQEVWDATEEAASHEDAPPAVIARITSIRDRLGDTRRQVKNVRATGLTILDEFVRERAELDAVLDRLVASEQDVWDHALTIESAPLWRVFDRPQEPARAALVATEAAASIASTDEALAYVERERDRLILVGVIFAALLAVLLVAGRVLERADVDADARPRVAAAADRPISGAILATMLLSMWMLPGLPPLLNEVLVLAMVLSWAMLIVRIVDPIRRRYMLVLAGLVMADRYLALILQSPAAARTTLFVVSVAAAATTAWILRTRPSELESPAQGWGQLARRSVPLLLVSFSVGALANLFGAVVLADLLTRRVLVIVTLALLFYPATLVFDALVLVILRRRGPRLFQAVLANAETLERWVLRLIHFGAFLLWLDFSLRYFGLSEASWAWCRKALATRLGFGESGVTIGGIVTVVGVFVATLLVSRILPPAPPARRLPSSRTAPWRPGRHLDADPLRHDRCRSGHGAAGRRGGFLQPGLHRRRPGRGHRLRFAERRRQFRVGPDPDLRASHPGRGFGQAGRVPGQGEDHRHPFQRGPGPSTAGTSSCPTAISCPSPCSTGRGPTCAGDCGSRSLSSTEAILTACWRSLGRPPLTMRWCSKSQFRSLLFDGFSETGLHFALQCWVPIANIIVRPQRAASGDLRCAHGRGHRHARHTTECGSATGVAARKTRPIEPVAVVGVLGGRADLAKARLATFLIPCHPERACESRGPPLEVNGLHRIGHPGAGTTTDSGRGPRKQPRTELLWSTGGSPTPACRRVRRWSRLRSGSPPGGGE